jgi:hypothetical protein
MPGTPINELWHFVCVAGEFAVERKIMVWGVMVGKGQDSSTRKAVGAREKSAHGFDTSHKGECFSCPVAVLRVFGGMKRDEGEDLVFEVCRSLTGSRASV